MSAMGNWLESQLRAHIFRSATFPKPTILAVALFTSDPLESGGGSELIGGSYLRVNLPPDDANWTAASEDDGIATNAVVVQFPTPTAAWGLVTHFAIFDAMTLGNLVMHGVLSEPRTISASSPAPRFAPGSLVVAFA